VLQPLIVRSLGGGKYELVAGERRLRAAKMAGLKKIPCIVRKTDDVTSDLYTIIENLQRSDLTVFEEAEGISRLICSYGLSQAEVAEKIGIAQSTLSNKLRLLRLDNTIRERIAAARLTERHARALLRIPEEKRNETLDHIIAKQLTLTETEAYVDKLLAPSPQKKEPLRKCAIGDVRLFANSLTKMVDTMRLGGVNAVTKRMETDTHIEYTVLITK
jgi:ParB family chromosome partitioning protein